MNKPIRISPEALAFEAQTLQRKLSAGLRTLRSLGDTHFGVTPKREVWRDGKAVLYRYQGEQKPSARVPTVICYALVNRPYMLDLQDDRSLVKGLLARGEDVYLLDWGYPDASDRFNSLSDYILGWLDAVIDFVRDSHGLPAVNLLGVCQGGAFSLCYASLRPHKVRNLITMVTPVDFHTSDNMLSRWARYMDVDAFVEAHGNIPADLMNACYLMLKPFRLLQQKYVGLIDILDDVTEVENFLRMERWIFDSPDQAGEAFREFIKAFYQGNGFVRGGVKIGGEEVSLARIDMPVLNIFAEQDHLVPPSASRPLGGLIGSRDYTELSFRGGHIGIYVSGRAQREVPDTIHGWLAER